MTRRRGLRVLVIVLVVLAIMGYAFYSLTGISVMPPKDYRPDGITLWFLRRGTTLPFLSSPDSQRQNADAAPTGTLVPLYPLPNRIIFTLPFNKALYLKTTGGVEFLK